MPPNFIFGTPSRIRTGIAAVKGQCPNHLDDGSKKGGPFILGARQSASGHIDLGGAEDFSYTTITPSV